VIDSAYVEQKREERSRTDQPVGKMRRKFIGLIAERKFHKCDTERALPITIIFLLSSSSSSSSYLGLGGTR
jgi:hypothetical protein